MGSPDRKFGRYGGVGHARGRKGERSRQTNETEERSSARAREKEGERKEEKRTVRVRACVRRRGVYTSAHLLLPSAARKEPTSAPGTLERLKAEKTSDTPRHGSTSTGI